MCTVLSDPWLVGIKKSTGRKFNKKMHLQDPDGVGGSGSLPPASDDDNAVSGTMGFINNQQFAFKCIQSSS